MAKKKTSKKNTKKPKQDKKTVQAKPDGTAQSKKDKKDVPLAELSPAKLRARHRKGNARHTLVLEADMAETQVRKAMELGDRNRMLGNRLTGELQKNIEQMTRTTAYQDAYIPYATVAKELAEMSESDPDYEAKALEKEMLWKPVEEIQKAWGVTKDDVYTFVKDLRTEYGVPSIFAQSRAEDIWTGATTVLYRGGHRLHFKSRGDLPELAAKQINRGIIPYVEDGKLRFRMDLPATKAYLNSTFEQRIAQILLERAKAAGLPKGSPLPELSQKEKDDIRHDLKLNLMETNSFGVKVKKGDLFAEEELANLIAFLEDPEAEQKSLQQYVLTGKKQETFRPCYATLCFERIRGKNRVFIHIVIEATACPKRRKDGSFRHTLGKGRVAGDLGPQSLASYSHGQLVLENIGEITPNATFRTERREKILQRSMDRSRRDTNPKYYNPNGTIKRGRKNWKKSRHYLKMQDEYREICRKNAINRKLANQRIAHRLRARGNVFITEPNNTQQMIASSRKKKKGPKKKPGTKRWSKEKRASIAIAEAQQTHQQVSAPVMVVGVATPAPSSTPDKGRKKAAKRKVKVSASPPKTEVSQPESPDPADLHKHRHSGRKKGGFHFTRSIHNRCPGFLYAEIKRVFTTTGGEFYVVPSDYAATQYNHLTDKKVKRELKDRMFLLDPDDPETKVQRDGHSTLNMYCANDDFTKPDRKKCQEEFPVYLQAQKQEIERIQTAHIKVCNSGIQV